MAMRAARSPSQGRGNRNPNIARDGIVCKTLVTPMTGLAHRGERVSQMPAGTAIMVALSMAAPVSQRCSSVKVAISPPYCEKKDVLMLDVPFHPHPLARDERRAHKPRSQDDQNGGT